LESLGKVLFRGLPGHVTNDAPTAAKYSPLRE
jgi:hypothetical protein